MKRRIIDDEGYLPDGSNPKDGTPSLKEWERLRRAKRRREIRKELEEEQRRIIDHFNAGLPGGTDYDGGE